MGIRRRFFCFILLAAGMLSLPGISNGQATNPHFDLHANDKAVDPSSLPASDDAKQALTQHMNDPTKGMYYVLAVGADPKSWAMAVAGPGMISNIADTARVALERCYYFAQGACAILSISGRDTSLPGGGWPLQPAALTRHAGDFDPEVVPFLFAGDREQLFAYSAAQGPRALVITTSGSWDFRSGDTAQKAIAAAEAACENDYKNETCILYAVNNHVVFDLY